MKIVLALIGILVFIVDIGYAQHSTSSELSKSDSLKQLIAINKTDDKDRVRLLNDYAVACFHELKFKEGLIATRDARILSEQIGFKGGEVMYFETLAAYHGSGSLGEYYQKKAERLSKSRDQDLEKYFVNRNPVNYNSELDCEKQLNTSTQLLDHFEQLGDIEIQANILYYMDYCQYALGNYEASLQLQERTIELFDKLQYVYPVFLISTEKNYNFRELGQDEEIEKNQAQLIEFVTEHENDNAYGMILADMARSYASDGRRAIAVEYYLKSVEIYEQSDDADMLYIIYNGLCDTYNNLERYDKSAVIYDKIIALSISQGSKSNLYAAYNKAAMANYFIQNYDKARSYMSLSLEETNESIHTYYNARQNSLEGQILKDQHRYTSAIQYFEKALGTYQDLNRVNSLPFMYMYIAECYQQLGQLPEALTNALIALQKEKEATTTRTKVESKLSLILSEIYEELGQRNKAYEYLKRYQEIRARKDQLDIENRLADIQINEIIQQSQIKIQAAEQERLMAAQESKTQRLWNFGISGALLSALLLSFILYRNNQSKKKANDLLSKQKEEIQSTLKQLKSTQAQLIQSEKMASLGELTAGIAHEIQNPLNFVNNFSDVSGEMIDEALEEMDNDPAEAKEILSDLKGNLAKISHHGGRASSIVKGMLDHSRASSGEKTPTDINALCDEYLRLSYHGLRAKDKSFNADFELDLDENLPKVNVVSQDIGRVLLNILNNAFYACAERLALSEVEGSRSAVNERMKNSGDEYYNPKVVIKTKAMSPSGGLPAERARGSGGGIADTQEWKLSGVEVHITDNGTGMSQETIDKVFQPFYTTKPTGQGTGLGMSISYDIVTKGHGGEMTVESEEGEGSTFRIKLLLSE